MRWKLGKGGAESPFSNSFYSIEKLTDYLEQSTIIKNYIPISMTMLSQKKGCTATARWISQRVAIEFIVKNQKTTSEILEDFKIEFAGKSFLQHNLAL